MLLAGLDPIISMCAPSELKIALKNQNICKFLNCHHKTNEAGQHKVIVDYALDSHCPQKLFEPNLVSKWTQSKIQYFLIFVLSTDRECLDKN